MTLGAQWSDPPDSMLYIYDVTTEEFTEIFPDDGLDICPSWSPVPIDGHYLIAFETSRDAPLYYMHDIYIVNPDTNEVVDVIDTSDDYSDMHPSWSPDGQWIVFNSSDGNDEELWLYEMASGDVLQLTDDHTYDGGASWCWGW